MNLTKRDLDAAEPGVQTYGEKKKKKKIRLDVFDYQAVPGFLV